RVRRWIVARSGRRWWLIDTCGSLMGGQPGGKCRTEFRPPGASRVQERGAFGNWQRQCFIEQRLLGHGAHSNCKRFASSTTILRLFLGWWNRDVLNRLRLPEIQGDGVPNVRD